MEPWKRNLYALWGTEFFAALGMACVLPFLPFYIRELGVQDPHDVERWSGLVFGGPFFAATFTGPLWGWLGDRYGRRLMLIRAVIGYAATTFCMAFAATPQQLFLLRILQGGIAGFVAATLAIVSTTTPRKHMGYAMGFLQTSLTAGSIIGPFIGGFLADLVGYRNIFFITGCFGAAAAVMVVFFVHEDKNTSEKRESPGLLSNYRFFFTSPALVTIFFASICVQTGIMAIQPVLSLFVETLWANTEYVATLAGAVFAITGFASLISAPYWGRRGDRLGVKRVLAINILGTALTFAPQAFVTQAYQLLLLRFIHGLFVGGILPALYTLTTLNVPEERRGGVLGITRSGLMIGNVIGPISGGFLSAAIGIRPLFVLTATLLASVFFIAGRFLPDGATPATKGGKPAGPGP